MMMKRILDCDGTLGSSHSHLSVAHSRWQVVASVWWVGGPVPVRKTQLVCCSNHCCASARRILLCYVLGHLDELLLEQGDVGTMPSEEEYGGVRAVARVVASAAFSDAIPIEIWLSVNTRYLVVASFDCLCLRLELLHCQDEESPLVRRPGVQLSDLISWKCAGTSDSYNREESSLLECMFRKFDGIVDSRNRESADRSTQGSKPSK